MNAMSALTGRNVATGSRPPAAPSTKNGIDRKSSRRKKTQGNVRRDALVGVARKPSGIRVGSA
jgi:hypothetical protein